MPRARERTSEGEGDEEREERERRSDKRKVAPRLASVAFWSISTLYGGRYGTEVPFPYAMPTAQRIHAIARCLDVHTGTRTIAE